MMFVSIDYLWYLIESGQDYIDVKLHHKAVCKLAWSHLHATSMPKDYYQYILNSICVDGFLSMKEKDNSTNIEI